MPPTATSTPPVSARFTVSVLDSAFLDVIVGALARADRSAVQIATGDISTLVTGTLDDVLRYVREVVADTAADGRHVSVTLSIVREGTAPASDVAPLEPVGVRARAHWSLPGDQAVATARSLGTFSGVEPFVTRLDGDLAAVLRTIAAGWLRTSEHDRPVVTHATIAVNSPTAIEEDS